MPLDLGSTASDDYAPVDPGCTASEVYVFVALGSTASEVYVPLALGSTASEARYVTGGPLFICQGSMCVLTRPDFRNVAVI